MVEPLQKEAERDVLKAMGTHWGLNQNGGKDTDEMAEIRRRRLPVKPSGSPSDSSSSEADKQARRKRRDKKIRKLKKWAAKNTSDEIYTRTVSDGSNDSSSLHSYGSTSEEGDRNGKARKGLNRTLILRTNTLFWRALDYRTKRLDYRSNRYNFLISLQISKIASRIDVQMKPQNL